MSVQEVDKSTRPPPIQQKNVTLSRIIIGQVIGVAIIIIAGWNIWPQIISWLATNELRPQLPDLLKLKALPIYVLVHMGAAITALSLGAVVLFSPKGNATHKMMGRVWVVAMVTTAVSSFFMESFAPMLGQFGPIHLLAVWTLMNMPRAILMARKGNIDGHLQVMKATYWGLVIAGVMTFIPGRVMFSMFFQ